LLIDTLIIFYNSTMSMIFPMILALVVGLLLLAAVRSGSATGTRYRKRTMLAGSDLEFFYRLQRALPACHIFPQVAMSALIEPIGIGKVRQSAFARIVGKQVGYAVFDEEMKLLAVVELDYRSRLSRRDVCRDAYFSGAGIKTVRFQSKRKPSESRIKASVLG
jgi:hypothetical protein